MFANNGLRVQEILPVYQGIPYRPPLSLTIVKTRAKHFGHDNRIATAAMDKASQLR
jgi:hypothetical protein